VSGEGGTTGGDILLRVVPPEGERFDFTPRGDAVVVGRALDCDLVLSDAFLSRQHARLVRDGGGWRVEDLDSRNGTHVNGERVEGRRPLAPGDVVSLSGSRLEVHAAGGGSGAARPTGASSVAGDATYFRSARELLESQQVPSAGAADSSADDVRRWAERLRLVNEVHRDLGRSLDLRELLERLLDRVFGHLRPERGVVYLARSGGEGFYAAARRAAPGADGEPLHSRHLLREVAEKGLAALVLDASTDERFSTAHSLLDFGVRSLVAAPLLEGDSSLGMIALDASLGQRRFQHEDLELLVSLASAAALRVRNLSLAEEAAERQRLESELALARRIQVALLPQRLPEAPGWSLHGGNLPSRGVSGDFYEVVERTGPGGAAELMLVVADVSGKGMAASLLTASLEALLAPLIAEGERVDAICTFASRLLFQRTPPEKYATAILAAVDVASGRLAYTVAGHNPALLVRAGGEVEELGATGPPLGLLPEVVYAAGEVELAPGDTVLLYTDGLVEAADPDDEEYGLGRAAEVCRRHRAAAPATLAAELELDVERFARGVPFADDRTLLIVQRSAG
jgi:phosphoserine phosphatase RsbU/P